MPVWLIVVIVVVMAVALIALAAGARDISRYLHMRRM
jgi:hypothetical protein